MKNLQTILKEEINKEVKSLNLQDPKRVAKVIKELFTFNTSSLLKNIGDQDEILDEKDALPEENWQWLISMINESFAENNEEWENQLKEQKLKILCFKYFTKQEFVKIDEIEKSLKVKIKKYFAALQNYSDLDNFREKFFNLPTEMCTNFSRYLLDNSKKLNTKIKIEKKEVVEKIKTLTKDRKEIIEKIGLVSKKYQSTLDLTKVKELCDHGLFFEDNILNRGVNEFISKLCNSEKSAEIKDAFNSTFLYDLKSLSEESASYIAHVDSIKKGGQEYFTEKGFQIGVRFDNAQEITENKTDEVIIDKNSRFKEPKSQLKSISAPGSGGTTPDAAGSDSAGPTAAGSSGGSSGGGGGDFGGGFSGPSGGDIPDLDSVGTDVDGGGEMPDAADGAEAEGGEESMPADEDGFPEDFGTPEDNEDKEEK